MLEEDGDFSDPLSCLVSVSLSFFFYNGVKKSSS